MRCTNVAVLNRLTIFGWSLSVVKDFSYSLMTFTTDITLYKASHQSEPRLIYKDADLTCIMHEDTNVKPYRY